MSDNEQPVQGNVAEVPEVVDVPNEAGGNVFLQSRPFPKFDTFDSVKEDFELYKRRFKIWARVQGLTETAKRDIFLMNIGAEAFSRLSSLCFPKQAEELTFTELIGKMENFYKTKKKVISNRALFRERKQEQGETVSDFVMQLKKLCLNCDYGEKVNEELRDQFIIGLKSSKLKKDLMLSDSISFEEAYTKALQDEAYKDLDPDPQVPSQTFRVQKRRIAASTSRKKERRDNNKCYRCNGEHDPKTCGFKTLQCFNCKKFGHAKRACRNNSKPVNQQNTHYIRDQGQQKQDTAVTVSNLYSVFSEGNGGEILVNPNVNGVEIPFVVDTAAALSIVPFDVYLRYFADVKLENSNVKLQSYSNDEIPVCGELFVDVKMNDQCIKVPLLVAKGAPACLFGRNWIHKFKLDWKSIFSVESGSTKGVNNILEKHSVVFGDDLGSIKGYKASIRLKDNAKPEFKKPNDPGIAIRPVVEAELDRLEQSGVLYRVNHSDWATPCVNVIKTNGGVRICGNYKVTVNKYCDVDQYPLPNTETMFANLSGGTCFTKIDLSQAFLQLELDEESKKLCTLNTSKGLYRVHRLPYGISSSPAIFQMTMDKILQGIPRTMCYIDDILIAARDEREHDEILDQVLQRLADHNIRVNKGKCTFKSSSVTYLGHVIDHEGIHPSTHKVDAIRNAPPPSNVVELRSWLGLVNYYSRFLENLSTKLGPLYELLKKDVSWNWSSECAKAFQACKDALQEDSVLVHYSTNLPVRLACDASSYGLGAVISHVMPDGSERPVAFASRTMSQAEKNYSQLEKEALAIMFGIRKFHKYLYGRKFTLITDCSALVTIFGSKKGIPSLAAARLQRWALILSGFSYEIEYKKSQMNANADGMSRLPNPREKDDEPSSVYSISVLDELPVTAKNVAEATKKDPVLVRVLDYVLHGWPDKISNGDRLLQQYFVRRNELSVDRDCLLWGMRVIIPTMFQGELLSELHAEHFGMTKTKALARSYIWWPGIDSDIEAMIKSCNACSFVKNAPPKNPTIPWVWTTRRMQRVHIDFAYKDGQNFFIFVDSYSKWLEVIPMNSTTSEKTIEVLQMLFASHGLPETLVSDNGPQFVSSEFEQFMQSHGIIHKKIPPYHAASNGCAERMVQEFKNAYAKFKIDKGKMSLNTFLAKWLLAYRTTPTTSSNKTPAELFVGQKLRTRLSLVKPNGVPKDVEEFVKYDEGTIRSFVRGEKVLVKSHNRGNEKWLPGVILKIKGPLTYLAKVLNGKLRYVHSDHLRKMDDTVDDSCMDVQEPRIEFRRQPVEVVNPEFKSLPVSCDNSKPCVEELPVTTQSSNVESHNHVEPVAENVDDDNDVVDSSPRRRYPTRIRKPPVRYGYEK